MPHLDLAVPSSRSARGASARGFAPTTAGGLAGVEPTAAGGVNGGVNELDVFSDVFQPDRSLSYLDLALPGPLGDADMDGGADYFGNGLVDDAMVGLDGSSSLDVQLAELSGLLGGDANAPQFLQEMLMLQMQAEAWRMQWSVAMQENEELRAKLYDTRNSLEAA